MFLTLFLASCKEILRVLEWERASLLDVLGWFCELGRELVIFRARAWQWGPVLTAQTKTLQS